MIDQSTPVHSEAALQRSLLFAELDEDDRANLFSRAHRNRYRPGQQIFHAGDPGDHMMTVLAGTVRISMPTSGGKDVILADLSAGEVLGEISVLDGSERSADAVAVTNVELLSVNRRDVLYFLSRSPEVCLRLLAHLSGMIRSSDDRMADIAFVSLAARLAKAMLGSSQPATAPNWPSRVSLSQSELARMIAASRESVNRQLSLWQNRGIVELRDGWIVLTRPDELEVISQLV